MDCMSVFLMQNLRNSKKRYKLLSVKGLYWQGENLVKGSVIKIELKRNICVRYGTFELSKMEKECI